MKQKKMCWSRLAGLLLALAMLASCGTGGETPETTTETTTSASSAQITTTVPEEKTFSLSAEVRVMRPEGEISEDLLTAVKLMTSATKSLLGTSVTISEDWYRGELKRNEFEILLGHTNRPESEEALDELTYYDYTYEVISPHVVVICGGSDSATLKATQKFLSDCYGYAAGKSGELRDIPVGTSYTYRHEYGVELTLAGKAIDCYTIVYKDSALHLAAAKMLRQQVGKVCGVLLPLSTVEEYRGGDAILLGMADTDGSHLMRDYGSYSFAVKRMQRGADCLIVLDTTAAVGKLARAFADTVLAGVPAKGTYDVEIGEEARVLCICADETNGLYLTGKEEQIIADGVVYSKRTYADAQGKPVIAYVVEADLTRVDVLNATPGYGNVIHNVKANTKQAMGTVAAAGYDVYAGVNADFFRISGDYSPQGLCIKEGTVLSGANSRPWFGITVDGAPVMGTASEYAAYAGKLREAVGGSNILLTDGLCVNVGYGTEFGYTRHPRTAVGVTAEGKLLLVVVDGRQPKVSNGASLADLANIFLELGATDAINLDGGGSSTMITSAEAGNYVTRNSPSDGSLRSVYNSLVIVGKK